MKNKAVVTPLLSILNDEKFILLLIYAIVQILIYAIPGFAPYADTLTKIAVIAFGFLIFHQSAEDALTAWQTGKPVDLTTAIQAIIAEVLPILLNQAQQKTTVSLTDSTGGTIVGSSTTSAGTTLTTGSGTTTIGG